MNAVGGKTESGQAVAASLVGITIALSGIMGDAASISQLQTQEIQQKGFSFNEIGQKIYEV